MLAIISAIILSFLKSRWTWAFTVFFWNTSPGMDGSMEGRKEGRREGNDIPLLILLPAQISTCKRCFPWLITLYEIASTLPPYLRQLSHLLGLFFFTVDITIYIICLLSLSTRAVELYFFVQCYMLCTYDNT